MRAPRTLVTGGTGFVGRFIVETLLRSGHEVVVAGRKLPGRGLFSARTGFVPLDLGQTIEGRALFSGIDFLVHGALDHVPGRYRGGEGDDADAFRARNLDGSSALFAAARSVGVRRAVFLSSRAVYGTHRPGLPLSEDDETRPDTLYGEIKRDGERALFALADRGFIATSLRITGVYGPAGPGRRHKWAPMFEDYLAGRPVTPRVGTEVHGMDVGRAVQLILSASPTAMSGGAYNVSDLVVDRRDVLGIVRTVCASTNVLPQRADASALNAMTTKRLETLGWRPGGTALFDATVKTLALEACAERPRAAQSDSSRPR